MTNMAKSRYHYPGEYTYKGILYNKDFPVDLLKEVEESLNLTPNHVVIASYPKSGQFQIERQSSIGRFQKCINFSRDIDVTDKHKFR